MGRNIFIAYLLWFFLGTFGAHRIYCGRFLSGFLQLFLFWAGSFLVVILVGYLFLGIWGLWWLIDGFLTQSWIDELREASAFEGSLSDGKRIENIDKLFELYKSGAMSYEEYLAKKDEILSMI